MTTHIFGIRHHGPGSARALRQALEVLTPDCLLIEGPPDATEVLPLALDAGMRPPVALLVYAPDAPRRAVFYPFAEFSPEWQAIRFGLERGIPTRFMDLPQAHQLGLLDETAPPAETDEGEGSPQLHPSRDPLAWLAEAAGYSDGERWWEQLVEHRRDATDLFAAILEAMTVLRSETDESAAPHLLQGTEPLREPWMRQTIRAAQREGFTRIAVVCGAWHAPALVDLADASGDAARLRGLPKIKLAATWTPWTYDRLSMRSGYGAGIQSPGWYEHLWRAGQAGHDQRAIAVHWMTRVARLLRSEDLDASAAHSIEAVRLAETLAAMRDRALPGLTELNEAARAVLCFGADEPMRLIAEKLIVGNVLGDVPEDTPLAPLQGDLLRQQKRLKLPAEASWRDYELDLRKPNDLERSQLLHRLHLLSIPWGSLQHSSSKGTFRELWRLQWQPELAVALIEAGVWGNTVFDAATAYAADAADKASDLAALTQLVNQVLLADLPDAITHLMYRLQAEAALASDIGMMMNALPPLATILRYGSVRRTDAAAVAAVVDGLAVRICVGLPVACTSLDDEAAQALFEQIVATQGALAMLQRAELLEEWYVALQRVISMPGCHGLVAGRACRILLDAGVLSADETTRRLGLGLSAAVAPAQAAAWIDGLLRKSGALLVHDDALWQIVDSWMAALPAERFVETLPLLRRTFSTFEAPERRMLGERARGGTRRGSSDAGEVTSERGDLVLPLVAQLLGLRT